MRSACKSPAAVRGCRMGGPLGQAPLVLLGKGSLVAGYGDSYYV